MILIGNVDNKEFLTGLLNSMYDELPTPKLKKEMIGFEFEGCFMSTIKIENLTFSYYGYIKPVFENVLFLFDTNWKTGLIGRNGIGKSTLFKLFLNQEVYQGKISKSVDFIQFPPNLRDTSKLGIELYKELISDEEEWKLFRELNLLNVEESLV